MPKFVPVVDNEKSLVEQREDTTFDKHRRFDNPHKVDRGWQQGNVGWGVLGAFGSDSKDDAAQVIKRAEGSNKMIKNEKGLWVKAKELEEDISHAKPGRGRGGGVSVYDELASRNMGSSESRNEVIEKAHNNQFDDADDYKGKRGGAKKSFDSHDGRGSHRQGSEEPRRDDRRDGRHEDRRSDRYSDRRDDGRDERRDDRGYDRSDRDRHRSRSPDRRRDDRDRRDSRRSPERRKRDSRSRSRSGDRRRNDRDYNRSEKGRDNRSRRSRSRSGSRNRDKANHNRSREAEESSSKNSASTGKKVSAKDIALTAEELAEQAELMRSITAVQVINRFHEVFAHDTLFPSERLNAIGQVFAPDAVIASLKSGVVHITGQVAMQESFAKTAATQPGISKRIYIEYSDEESTCGASGDVEAGEVTSNAGAPKVTFCLDFHRPATAPGLGDRSKHTVLLYRCANAVITHIWGMVDHEQLSQPEEIEKSNIMKSKVWACVKPIVTKDLLSFDESRDAHFHNYDRMEVWGMF
eukprot:gene12562-14528_t